MFSHCGIAMLAIALCSSALRAADVPLYPPSRYASWAMMHPGDPAKGKELFFNQQKLACSQCHSIDGTSSKAGPDLFSIGDKFGRADLIESILHPSSTIAVGYSTTIVETRSGEVFDGILKDVTDAQIKLMLPDAQLLTIATRQIRHRRTIDTSLMPEGLQTGLTLAEFTDLVDFLATLQLPASAMATHQGMPAEIPALKTPVALVPFIRPEDHFDNPTWFGPLPGVANAFLVIEHETGKIWRLDKSGASETKSLFLATGKFDTGTRGLLGMAFHPQFTSNRRYFYVKHLIEQGRIHTVLFEGLASTDLKTDSGQPPKQLLKIDNTSNVHYGGCLQFGPDGYLYMGMGDSGPQQDPSGNGQNLSVFMGKILRLDIDHADPGLAYAIPKDNPLVVRPGARPEIYAYGFREPWRFTFDPPTHDLWVGDVGQDLYEEVDLVQKGKNYGWNVYEAFHPFSNLRRRENETYTPPVFAYSRKYGFSVTGGYVYRADPSSSFYGVYIFADFQVKRLFALTQKDGKLVKVRQIALPPQQPVSFGQDTHGELYVVGYQGMIYRLDLSHARFE